MQLSPDISIFNMDCMEKLHELPRNEVECVLTDIPFAEVSREHGGLRELNKGAADDLTFSLENFLEQIVRVCYGSFYIFCGQQQYSTIDSFFRENDCTTRTIVWEKTNPSPQNGDKLWLSGIELAVFARKSKATFNGHCRNTVLRFPCGTSKQHPTQKPLELFSELLQISSSPTGLVMDPCMGSGTTGVAAARLNRRFIGVELNTQFFSLSKQRIQEAIAIQESQIL